MGADLRHRAHTAHFTGDGSEDHRHREVLIPGRRSFPEQVRWDWLGTEPSALDTDARRQLFPLERADVHRHEVLHRWATWRQQIGDLLETVADPVDASLQPAVLPVDRWARVLAARPALSEEPTGGGLATGLGSAKAQALLDSIAARAVLIAALQGQQYSDAADLADSYPANPEFLTAEVSLALQIPESEAAALLCTGATLATRLPATLAAARAGRITADAAQVIVGATAVLDDIATAAAVERAVLPHTRWKTRESLRRRVVREVIRHDPDGADRRHRIAQRARCVSKWSDVDGMGWLKLHAAAQDITAVWEAVTGLAQAARTPGCDTTLDQRRADAMVDVFAAILHRGGVPGVDLPQQHGRRPHIGVLIPADLLTGLLDEPARTSEPGRDAARSTAQPVRGVSEIPGYGPIAPVQALQLAAEGLWRRLVCDPQSGRLLDYGRTRYEPPDALKQFVVTRDQRCRHPGCSLPAWRTQIDHVRPYAAGGRTDEANLTCLCQHHHRAKDGGGFTLRIHPDRSTTWTTPLGRTLTTAPDPLLEPTAPRPPVSAPERSVLPPF